MGGSVWGVEEVVAWLGTVGVGVEVGESFRANGIDGEMLLLLSEEDLRDELGVEGKEDLARILAGRRRLASPALSPLSATASLWRAQDGGGGVLSSPRALNGAVTIQAAVRGWISRRHMAAVRTPSRWLLCGAGPNERPFFFNEMTLVSTYTPPPVLEKYLDAGADGVSRLRRAADEPAVEISPPGMLAPGQRPRWAQVDNGFVGVDRPRPALEPGRPPPTFVKPLPDHVVEATPLETVALPPPRWQPRELPEFAILKGSKAAAAAQPAIDIKAEILRAKVLPAVGAALVPAVLSSHQMGDRRKLPSAHVPLAKVAATLAETQAAGDERGPSRSFSPSVAERDLLPQDPVGVLYDQLRPALAAALARDAVTASEADGGGVAAIVRELNGWVSDKADRGAGTRPSETMAGERHLGREWQRGQRGFDRKAGGSGLVVEPQPEPEPEPELLAAAEAEEVISSMALFATVRPQQRASILRWLVHKSFRSGELICREGDLSNDFYIVQRGEVRAVKSRGTTKEELLKSYRAGEYFGELALLTNEPRAASCVATAPKGGRVELLQLSRSGLDQALGPFKDMIKAQMLSRASAYTIIGGKSLTQAEEERANQRKQELRRLFDEIDDDGSGAIDREELRMMLTKLGKASSDAMLDRAMSMMDPDGDGLISFAEFAGFWGEDGSGVDRLANLEAAIGGMLDNRTPTAKTKDNGSAVSSSPTGQGRLRFGVDDDDENDSDDDDAWQ